MDRHSYFLALALAYGCAALLLAVSGRPRTSSPARMLVLAYAAIAVAAFLQGETARLPFVVSTVAGNVLAWLGLLAWVAEDGWPPSRDNLLGPHAAALRPFDAEGAEAVQQLGEVMAFGARRNWRAPQLRIAVARGDAPFRAVLAALGRLLPPDAPAQATLTHIADGHALLLEREARLAAPETARLLRLQESELRRLMLPGG
jgi:hypothetical protein